jgi:hypothetical protein
VITLAITKPGTPGAYAIVACGFFLSIMFRTIFALGLKSKIHTWGLPTDIRILPHPYVECSVHSERSETASTLVNLSSKGIALSLSPLPAF